MVIDFGALAPEINATRLYAGPGSAPMQAAAAAWQRLAAELSAAAASCEQQITGLAAAWQGAAGHRMAVAAARHIQWLATTAAQAAQAGAAATAQALAYETARAATTPPPVIAANRSLQATLIATNVLGQNTGAIMSTEAQYLAMWAQCAAAMYGYATATEQSSALPDHPTPQPATGAAATPVGELVNAVSPSSLADAPHQLATGLSDTLQPLYYGAGAISSGAGFIKTLAPGTGALGSPAITGAGTAVVPPGTAASVLRAATPGAPSLPAARPVTAHLAGATRIGGLTVPSGWATANATAAAATGPTTPTVGVRPQVGAAGNMLGGVPLSGAAAASRGPGDGVLRVGPRAFVMPRPLSAG
ncbi:PPE family protein [Mycobacterium koreense]|nr:PPE domain-containing protein [Mycolicibacillus koreensis]MCV7248633.1 PPE family protein [Mycolicibacillus koreensis]BBY55595.1 PPE family protein [Mycolicibacillus koreensis]